MVNELKPVTYIQDIIPLYFVEEGFDLDLVPDNYAYIMDGKGVKILKRNMLGTFLVEADKLDEKLPTIKERTCLNVKKIPPELIAQVATWFKAVYDKQTSEAVVFLFYHECFGWEAKPPKQEAVGMSVDYEERPEMGDGWKTAGTIHSHCTSTAFHSGTDDDDEKQFDGVHLTIGKVMSDPVEIAYSLMIQGKRFKMKREDIIDEPPEAEFPEEWMDEITKKTYAGTVVAGFTSHYPYNKYYDKKKEETPKTATTGGMNTQMEKSKVNERVITSHQKLPNDVPILDIIGLEGYMDDDDTPDVKFSNDDMLKEYEDKNGDIIAETDDYKVTRIAGMPVYTRKNNPPTH